MDFIFSLFRNSAKIVEAAFDGDLDELKSWLDKGYHLESYDGRKHTALSEAACQGQMEVAKFLLEKGADPNALSDTGRSPLWRACFNGHFEMAELLLHSGANPEYRDRVSMENAFDVCKTDELRKLLSDWDPAETQRLMEKRKREITAQLESRIQTAAEREEFAKQQIRKELVERAEVGDAAGIKELLGIVADEAVKTNTKPR